MSRPDETTPVSDAVEPATLVPEASGPSADVRAPAGYAIERELGRGGMGIVYLARDLRLKRHCALKVILAGAHANDAEASRFKAEAVARLQHPGIVQVFEVGEHDGRPFMALEYCPGGSLHDKLAKNPLPPREAADLVRQLAEAVHAAHEARVIHRDLKPANVLLGAGGQPKVADFGLAKKLDEAGPTRTGSVLGTPSYMPPEQAAGRKEIGRAADVYALGAILYECLTGRPPFRAATPWDTIRQVLETEPVPPRRLNPQVPVDLETICLKCLRKPAVQRYATAKDLADDLARYLAGQPVRARRVGPLGRAYRWVKRNRVVAALATAVVATLVTALVVTIRQGWETARALEQARDQLDRAELALYAGQLSQAQAEYQSGNVPRALEILDGCRWDLRNVEFGHLWKRFDSRQTFRGHRSEVTRVEFSPDGKRVVSWSPDGTASVWDSETGLELPSLRGPGHYIAFSPDGKRAASHGTDQTVKVWDVENRRELLTLAGAKGFVRSVAFSPDGKRIACGVGTEYEYSGELRIWDANNGAELVAIKLGPDGKGGLEPVWSVAFSPDGKTIVGGLGNKWAEEARIRGEVKLWAADTGTELFSNDQTTVIQAVAFSPDGTRIASAGTDGSLRFWDAQTGQEIPSRKGHLHGVNSLAFSPDGTRIACGIGPRSSGQPGEVKIWETGERQEFVTLRGHTDAVSSVAFSPDGRLIASGSHDKTAKVWDAATGEEIRTLRGKPVAHFEDIKHGRVSGVCFSRDGKSIGSSHGVPGDDGPLGVFRIWDAETGTESRTFSSGLFWSSKRWGASVLSFSTDGTSVLIEGSWLDAETGRRHPSVGGGHMGSAYCTALSPDGINIVSGSDDKTAKLWDTGTRKELRTFTGHLRPVTCVAFSPDGKRVLTGSEDRTLQVWDIDADPKLEPITLKGHMRAVTCAVFSPDGKRILSGSADRTMKVWDADKGQELLTLQGSSAGVTCLAFSHDGKRVVCGCRDGTLMLWKVDERPGTLTLNGPLNKVACVAFSRDGKHLVSGSTKGVDDASEPPLRIWDLEKGRELLALKAKVADRPASDHVGCVAYFPDGKRIISGGDNESLRFWEAATGKELPPMIKWGSVTGIEFSPDGSRLLLTTSERFKVFDANSGREIHTFDMRERYPIESQHRVCTMQFGVFSPDGNRILSASFTFRGGQVFTVWDAETGQELLFFKGHPQDSSRAAFSPDGKRVFAWGNNGQVLAWSASDGKPIEPVAPPPDMPRGAARSADGRFYAEPRGNKIAVIDLQHRPTPDPWPLPDVAARRAYHGEHADRAEQQQRWFAVAFHLNRLLLDDPGNADLKRRRDDALRKHDTPAPKAP